MIIKGDTPEVTPDISHILLSVTLKYASDLVSIWRNYDKVRLDLYSGHCKGRQHVAQNLYFIHYDFEIPLKRPNDNYKTIVKWMGFDQSLTPH